MCMNHDQAAFMSPFRLKYVRIKYVDYQSNSYYSLSQYISRSRLLRGLNVVAFFSKPAEVGGYVDIDDPVRNCRSAIRRQRVVGAVLSQQ
jgi:hypothetical protein